MLTVAQSEMGPFSEATVKKELHESQNLSLQEGQLSTVTQGTESEF